MSCDSPTFTCGDDGIRAFFNDFMTLAEEGEEVVCKRFPSIATITDTVLAVGQAVVLALVAVPMALVGYANRKITSLRSQRPAH